MTLELLVSDFFFENKLCTSILAAGMDVTVAGSALAGSLDRLNFHSPFCPLSSCLAHQIKAKIRIIFRKKEDIWLELFFGYIYNPWSVRVVDLVFTLALQVSRHKFVLRGISGEPKLLVIETRAAMINWIIHSTIEN